MASKIDIWNLALSHVGASATIADPNEQGVAANHCRRFYPVALSCTLERHSWSFATRRVHLVPTTNPVGHWMFAYVLPIRCVRARAVLPPGAADDTQEQPYAIESLDSGTGVIYSNTEQAVLKYTALVEDVSKFTPFFTLALSYDLAAMLVGPISKDERMKARLLQSVQYYIAQAQAQDANSSMSTAYRDFIPSHLAARNG
ncbi:hypothetical protein ABS755_08065 [Castellaniella sp. FW104-16D08]|uniref:hypothetical protein n=1 Tax=unclassified Castellaniella TaxID=2617606 RepID=UPI003315D23B